MSNYRKSKALTKLIIKTFLGEPMGIIMSIVAPSILLILIPFLINGMGMGQSMSDTLRFLAPGLISIPSLMIGLVGIPLTYSTLKETTILRKFKIVGIKPLNLLLTFALTFLSIIFVSTVWLYTLSKIIWQGDAPDPASAIVLIPLLMNGMVAISFGLLIANTAKDAATSFAMGIAAFLPTIFLSGSMFPKMSYTMNMVSQVIPQKHTIRLFEMSWTTGDLYIHKTIPGMNDALFSNTWQDTVLVYLYPTLFCSFVIFTISRKFKWE